MKRTIFSFWIITISIIIVKLAIHFLTSTIYELHRDEFLYFVQGRHLSPGYASTPPFIGFLAFIIRTVFGYSEFGIKLFPALAGAASVLIIALMVKEFGGRNLAVITACTGYVISGSFLRSNSLFMPVSFDQFFWLLIAYLTLKLVLTGNHKIWLWIGIVAGIGFLNKYSILFFIFAMFVALLISNHRKIFLTKYFIFGTLAGFLIILPNLIWQYLHNWPVVNHMVELQRTQLANVTIAGFLLDQVWMSSSSLFIWMPGLFMLILIPHERKLRYIGLTFLVTLLVILLFRGKSYYTLGAYSMLLAAGGYLLEKYLHRGWRTAIYVMLFLSIIGTLVWLPLSLPFAPYPVVARYTDPERGVPQRWEDGKIHPIPQDYADMTGWKELTMLVVDAFNSLTEEQQSSCDIFAQNYGQAAAIDFYGHKYHLPDVISFNDSYISWAPDSISSTHLIVVDYETGDIDKLFFNFECIGQVNNEYFRENGVKVFLCSNPRPILGGYYTEKLSELRNAAR